MLTSGVVSAIIFLVLVSVTGTLGNCLVLLSVVFKKSLQTKSGILVAALAVTDLFTSAVLSSLTMVSFAQGGKIFLDSDIVCRLYGCLFIQSGAASIFCMTAIAVNRYLCMCHNQKYKKWASKKITFASAFGCHISAVFFSLPPLFGFSRYHYIDQEKICLMYRREEGFNYLVFLAIFTFIVPFSINAFCYFKVWQVVRKSQIQIANHIPDWQTTSSKPTRKDIDIAKSVFVVFVVYVVCMAPYKSACTFNPAQDPPFGLVMMFLANSALNPFVYCLLVPQYRHAFMDTLFRKRRTAASNDDRPEGRLATSATSHLQSRPPSPLPTLPGVVIVRSTTI